MEEIIKVDDDDFLTGLADGLFTDDENFRLGASDDEEVLEWINNKNVFPEVETLNGVILFGDKSFGSSLDLQSPDSVLSNSSMSVNIETSRVKSDSGIKSGSSSVMSLSSGLKVPARARSNLLRRRRVMPASPWQSWIHEKSNKGKRQGQLSSNIIGRKCMHCQIETTPQWREGPKGPKTLCNACGVRWKSGRLHPEYRPVNSPTFMSGIHSNSHRKVMKIREMKVITDTSNPAVVCKTTEIE